MLRSRNSPTRSSFAASPAQREKVADQACIVCWKGPCDPAHVVPRSLAPDRGGDPIRVVPLCRLCHTHYDQGVLDLLPHLNVMAWRHELAHAVLVHPGGIVGALERITNTNWHAA
jgi:hypothetical protein